MTAEWLARGSVVRRLATRAIVIFGAVWLGGIAMRSLPHDQVLLFPVGSVFPNATRFAASWRQAGDKESRGGVTLTFTTPPPLQIRQHASLPNGDYVVSIEVTAREFDERAKDPQIAARTAQVSRGGGGMQTNIERRVTLAGGETTIALAAGGF
ncbi:MAG TPA: hypothetical protein VGM44_01635 [Polyangiaceae bacterium]